MYAKCWSEKLMERGILEDPDVVGLKNVGCETADWIYFCQDSDQWQVASCCELETP
jgi:hypothetical protein